MPEEALLDAAVETEPIESTESPVETQSDDTESTDVSTETSTESPELRGSSLWRDVKGDLYSGKALTKDKINLLRNAIRDSAQFSQKYPEGLGQIEQRLSAVQSLIPEGMAFEEGLQRVKADSDGLQQLYSQFSSADPKFVDDMIE